MLNFLKVSFLLLMLLKLPAYAGEYNEKLNILGVAPAWTNLPGVGVEALSLSDLKEKDVIVVAFTCNSCPYAVDYEDRLIELSKKYAKEDGQVAVVAINVNLIDEDNLEAMTKRAEEKKFSFPYLFDESQDIAKEYGASRTPEFFVLNKKRQVVYMGAFDDNTDATKVTKHYVDDAIQATLKGERPAVVETVPIGCSIRYLSERQRQRLEQRKKR